MTTNTTPSTVTTSFSRRSALVAVLIALLAATTGFFIGALRVDSDAETHDSAVHTTSAETGQKTGLAAADVNGDGIVYQDGMHPQIVQDEPGTCPICGMELMPVRVDGAEEGTVRIDPVTMQNIGVRTAPVTVASLQRTVRTTGRFEANEQRAAVVSPKISGWVETLHVNYEGARVQKGQPLLEIYSPELVSTQEEYLLALRNAERLGNSDDARRLVDAARRRLAYWDISDEQVRRLEATGEPTKTLTLYAPAAGTVTGTAVVEGQKISAGQTLMTLSDLRTLWLMVDVYEQDLSWVRPGTAATITLPYAPGRTLEGRVDYMYDELNSSMRTVKARIEVPNPSLQLKPGMYATVQLEGGATDVAPIVPAESIVHSGDHAVVIVALGDGRFRPVTVTPGVETEGRTQILAGLEGDEEVVTSAQFLIDSEARLASAVNAMMGGHNHGAGGTRDDGAMPEMKAEASGAMPMDHAPAAGTPAARTPAGEPQTADGVQVVAIDIDGASFEPARITLQKGVPARLVFTRHTDATCATEIMIPALGVDATSLPLDEPVEVEVTPREDGTFTFACGMDMVKGTLVVTS